MVDEKKTILMTKLAIFEKHEKNKSLVVSKYYRRDYVRYNVLKTWVAATVLYWSIVAGYVFMAFDSILERLNDLDYFGIVYKMLGGYVIVCLVYFLFATILYNYRYKKAKEGLTEYNVTLKALIHADDAPDAEQHMVSDAKRTTDDVSVARTQTQAQERRAHVSRSEMINRQIQEQQERKNQEIIENVKKRNARVAAQKEQEQLRQQDMEEERRRIRARREQLEREQLEQLRNQRNNQNVYRENHVYNTDTPNRTGRGE